jgi:hypothetical protein
MPILGITASSKLTGTVGVDAYESIASTYITSGSAASITFSSLGSYKHLQIRGYLISNGSNGDPYWATTPTATGGYQNSHGGFDGGTAPAVFATRNTNGTRYLSWGTNYNNTNPMSFVMDILNYSSTTEKKIAKTFIGIDRQGTGMLFLNSNLINDTSAITALNFSAHNNAYGVGTYIGLYGIVGTI